MDHTELIKPNDPMSSSPCGITKILLGKLAPKTRFQVKEWKRIVTGVTVMLTRPSVLCVCDMWTFEQHRPYLRGIFHVVDSTHGTGNLALTVHNLRKKAVKAHRMDIRSPTFCAFALALDAIETVPLQLNRVPSRKRDNRKTATAKVTTASTVSGQKVLRLTVNTLKWQPHSPDTKSALVSATLDNIDTRKIGGFDLKTISDTNTAVAEAEMSKGTKTVILRLSHHTNHGQPPESLVMLLAVITKKATVTMKQGTDSVLQRLSPNGFRVQPQRPLKANKGDELSIATNATYMSKKYTALFLPYLFPALDISVSVWLPGTPLDIRLTATEDVHLPANTPIGEVRFIAADSIRVTVDRHTTLTAPQSNVTAHGPKEFKVIPHGTNTLQERSALMETPGQEREEESEPIVSDNEAEMATIPEDQDEDEDDIYYDDEEDEDEEESVDEEDIEELEIDEDVGRNEEQDPDIVESERDSPHPDDGTQTATVAVPTIEEEDITAAIPEGPILDYRNTFHRYMSENYTQRRRRYPPADLATWNIVQRVKKDNQKHLREKYEDDYAFELMIRLHPLNAKILPSALAPFMFMIPRQAFDPRTDPFYFTFLSRERDVLMFNTLLGHEVASSRNERTERGVQKVLRI